jgi:hypothetical protein
LGFAIGKQAHHNGLPNRVYLYYGLIVHLPLLPTPPCGDAVTFGYGMPEHPDKDFHLADSMPLPAHSPFAPRKDFLRPFCGFATLREVLKDRQTNNLEQQDAKIAKKSKSGNDFRRFQSVFQRRPSTAAA